MSDGEGEERDEVRKGREMEVRRGKDGKEMGKGKGEEGRKG